MMHSFHQICINLIYLKIQQIQASIEQLVMLLVFEPVLDWMQAITLLLLFQKQIIHCRYTTINNFRSYLDSIPFKRLLFVSDLIFLLIVV